MRYRITNDNSEMDVAAIHAYLSRSYWSENVPQKVVEKAIANSLCFGVIFEHDGQKEQVAFARLITDSATFAYLADVYVLEEHRGQGLSKKMMSDIIKHPQLQGLRRMMLATRDAHSLYEQFGFTPITDEKMFMQLWQPNIYQP